MPTTLPITLPSPKSIRPAAPRRRHALLCVAAVALLTQLPACATERAVPTRHARAVVLSIIDRDSGETLTPYAKDGRTYVAGRPASRYAIRLNNGSGARVLVVLSVDGVNVVSGETAAVGQTGYVLDPWRSYDIAGWRKSDSEIAAFVFAALSDSYAARTGRPDNVGVIGMAVFQEKPAPTREAPLSAGRLGAADAAEARAEASKADSRARNAAPPAPAAQAAGRLARTESLGTGHGEREGSVSRRTAFERLSSSPQQVVEIAYDSYANLVAAGVIATPTARARAFPDDDPRSFVPDPPRR